MNTKERITSLYMYMKEQYSRVMCDVHVPPRVVFVLSTVVVILEFCLSVYFLVFLALFLFNLFAY